MRNKLLFVLLSSILFFSCNSLYKVYEVKHLNNKKEKSGFFYFLPNNVFKICVEVEKQEFFKGPYADFAKQYFGLNNAILYNDVNYSISNIYIDVISEPDSSQCYLIVPNKSNFNIQLSKTGIIESFNCLNNDYITSETKHFNNFFQNNRNYENSEITPFSKIVDFNVIEKVDTIVRKIKLDTNFIIEKSFNTSIVQKSTEQKVKEIAENISKLKEAKYNIITGEIEAIDKKNLEFMYSELQNMENEYLKLFTGIKNKTTYLYTFYCYPIKDTLNNVNTYKLFSFSNTKGVLDNNSIEGDWIFLELNNKGYYALVEKYLNNFIGKSNKSRGLYYRIPALVDVSIKQGDKKLYSTQKYLSQFGTVVNLPNQNLSVIFDKQNGLPVILKSTIKN